MPCGIGSDGIKLNRNLGMIDSSMYGLMMDIDGPDFVKDVSTTRLLVPRLKKVTYQGKS